MQVRVLLPDSKSLIVDCIEVDEGNQSVSISVVSAASDGKCPQCQQPSERIHSRYLRHLSDLPWQGLRVRLLWQSRKFFCDSTSCCQKIFTERLPEVAATYSRRSERFSIALRCLAFACGGEEGARLAERLGMTTSPDTLLRQIRRTDLPTRATPRALGVDDWAFRKGKRYGTIFVDLETGNAVELLPERSADAVKKWLEENPGIEIISRDRGDCYIKGATEGAPNATQVADRFHLVQNMREAIVRLLDKHSKEVQQAVKDLREEFISKMPDKCPAESKDDSAVESALRDDVSIAQQKRSELYETANLLHQQGISNRDIAKRMGIHRDTVNKYVRSDQLPEPASRAHASQTDQCVAFLCRRWNEGIRNAQQLTREVQAHGFKVSYWSIRRRMACWRKGRGVEKISGNMPKPSSTKVSFLLLKDEAKLTDEERSLKRNLLTKCGEIKDTLKIAAEFLGMVRSQSGHLFSKWLDRATDSKIPVEFRRFAEGLKKDLAAVTAGLTLHWNNGPSEGHVNRLKMVKRQMYGRANFDLLRMRFLYKT